MRLTQADLERLSKTIKALYSAPSVGDLTTAVLQQVHGLIPSDAMGVTLVPTNGQAIVHHNAPHLDRTVSDRLWALRDFLHQHPLESAGDTSAAWGATCLSDFLTRQQLRRTDLYNEFYRHLDINYQLGIYTERVGGFRIGISCNGHKKDFTDRDRTILTNLAPHLAQAYKNGFEVAKIRKTARAFEAAAEAHRHGFIRVDRDGGIIDMTSLAGELLRKYFGDSRHARKSLPQELLGWLAKRSPDEIIATTSPPLVITKSIGTLIVRTAGEQQFLVLLLAEQRLPLGPVDLAPLGLRPREQETLFWLCHGKSNSEIASILSVSIRTIHKHNENIFRKLGVENRHAAIAIAGPLLRHL